MKYRPFGEESIAEIGLGTWQLGSSDWGVVNEEDAFEVLKTYIDAGGNFIDTADVYGSGVSEQVIGKFLKSVDKPVFVASKCGRRHDGENGWPQNFSYDGMKRHVVETLQRLDVPQLFLEQLHCIPEQELRAGKVFEHLRSLQNEGLIRYWGVSVETSEEALFCLDQDGINSIQIIFNMFRQHVAEEVFEKARAKNVAIIARVPLASGLLTGKFSEKTVFSPGDHRHYNANGEAFNVGETFSGIEYSRGVLLAREINTLLPDDRMAQWALRWILDHPEVSTIIPGASKVSQVQSNVEASSLNPLPPETHRALRELYNKEIYPEIRGRF